MRPVNLIPPDQRKGAARAAGATTAPVRIYALLGVLGVALLCVLALVLTSNSINSKTEELAKVQVSEQGVKQVADALRPYGQFAQVQQARRLQIEGLVSSRFNWERALRQLSRAIPEDVWLLSIAGTNSPEVEISATGGAGDVSSLRDKADAPALTVTGCAFSQAGVARMMTRMQNLDDVTDVQLAKSARKDEQPGQAAVAAAAGGQGGSQSSDESASECSGSARVTTFDMLIIFGAAPGAATTGSAGGSTGAPTSTAQAVGAAQGAAASSSASPGGTP